MKTVATLTMNPTIDLSYEVDRLVPTLKMRARNERYAPGGGGINVARVFVRLGGNARCYYLSGGATGQTFDGLVDLHQLVHTRILISEPTRVATAVYEKETGEEYHFTPAGPTILASEWQACLVRLEEADCDILVISGSLPQGVPADFYARVVARMAKRGIETVLDTSGDALAHGVAGGKLMLIKPNIAELQQLVNRTLDDPREIAEAAEAIVAKGHTRLVAVTMGNRGALLASEAGSTIFPALPIEAKSAVGAGDSFVAAMVHALARGCDPLDAFRHGIAAGTAAVMTPGSDLAYPADIKKISAAFLHDLPS